MVKRERPVQDGPTEEKFEEFVAAALKVDPKGLSGKHRKGDAEPDPGGAHTDR